jgi:hypothetical protein
MQDACFLRSFNKGGKKEKKREGDSRRKARERRRKRWERGKERLKDARSALKLFPS